MELDMRLTKLSSVIGACVALALLATACGSGSSPVETLATETEPASTSQSQPADAGESPIGDLLGIPITNDDAMEEYFGQLQRDAERKIAECMIAEGFQYKAVDYSNIDGLTANVDYESREFAENYGFGVTSNPEEEAFEAFRTFEDPNQEYLDSLSVGESEAYQTALNGELPDFDASEEFDNFEPGGCQGAAYEEVFAFGLVFDQFENEFEEIEQAYNADPRIVAATAGWSSCMGDAGYSFSNAEDAESDFDRRYRLIVNDPDAFVEDDEPGESTTVLGAGTEDVFFGPATLKPAFQQRVDDLAVEERAVAVASWDCNAPLREIADDVQLEYEQRFVDEHGTAIRAALDG